MNRETILSVTYTHIRMGDGDDLYLTPYGEPFLENLLPHNIVTDPEWFSRNATQLFGIAAGSGATSNIYRVRTKPVRGRHKDVVLKWNRMGEDIPGAENSDDLMMAEFNSPFEEFALVMEMRNSRLESPGSILTHRPLAIYVPATRLETWQTGRKENAMASKQRRHSGVRLDQFRSYAVIYEWIKGIDAAEACRLGALTEPEMIQLTLDVDTDMAAKGFRVLDRKPQHVIVRVGPDGRARRDPAGRICRAVVDFELLARTPSREAYVQQERRRDYLKRQPHRFDAPATAELPEHLCAVNVLGVDYIHGPAESTGGELWVVGRDATLFDYFLPERWERMPREKQSVVDEVYRTRTKDNIQLTWKYSRVGQRPDMDPFREEENRILEHGYNSPFEEFALALSLRAKGIPTAQPRAIYLTGQHSALPDFLRDDRRYASHAAMVTPLDEPVLRMQRDYILIWGYWNKPDEMLAEADLDHYQSFDALQALQKGVLQRAEYLALMRHVRDLLARVGVTDLNLRGNHILVALAADGSMVRTADGLPEMRLANFELLEQAASHESVSTP